MQQKNSTKPVHGQSVDHDARGLASVSRWVVDSKPLKPGKYNVAMAHGGCACSEAPTARKKK